MAVPTISGRIRLPDDTVHTGPFRLYRRSGPMLNGTTLVGLSAISLTTETDGDFSTPLHPGEYVLDMLISRYPGAPPFAVVFRVPNTAGTLNFSDLEFVTRLPDPSWFGGDLGGGADVDTATTSVQGVVKINVTDADPVAVVKSSLDGSDGLSAIFKPVAGKIYIRNTTTGDYHELTAATFGSQVQLGLSQTPVDFASLPAA